MNNSSPGIARNNRKAPRCERHDAFLHPEEQAESAARFPVGYQAQMAFLLSAYAGNASVVAALLGTRARNGAPSPPWVAATARAPAAPGPAPACPGPGVPAVPVRSCGGRGAPGEEGRPARGPPDSAWARLAHALTCGSGERPPWWGLLGSWMGR